MRKRTKLWLWIASGLILLGCVILGGVMSMLKWDFTQLSTRNYVTNQHEITEDFQNITIIARTANITFAVSEDGKQRVTCHEQKNAIHSVSTKDGELVVELLDNRKWYEHFGIGFEIPKITVYLPGGAYGMLSVNSTTGNIRIPKDFSFENMDISASTGDIAIFAPVLEDARIKATTGSLQVANISAGSLALSVTTGKVTVSNVSCTGDFSVNISTGKIKINNVLCKNLTSAGSTGDISLENVTASESLLVERSTGDIELHRCDAASLCLETDTGDVEGSLRSEKVFMIQTDTGDVEVPKTTTGGRCEIRTDTGDIEIEIIP